MTIPTEYSPEWTAIGQSVLNENADFFKSILELGIGIGYVTSKESPKSGGKATLAKCIAVKKDHMQQFIPHDYLIVIYEPNVMYMNDMQKRILIEHELMHIKAKENDEGDLVLSTNQHDVEDFREIIEKYGYSWSQDLHQQMTWDEYENDEDPAQNQIEGTVLLLPGEETA